MKRVISIVFFCVFSVYYVGAQTSTSSQKKVQITEVSQPVATTTVQSSNTATLVSGERNSVIREVPLENQQETTPIKSEIISTERKPQ